MPISDWHSGLSALWPTSSTQPLKSNGTKRFTVIFTYRHFLVFMSFVRCYALPFKTFSNIIFLCVFFPDTCSAPSSKFPSFMGSYLCPTHGDILPTSTRWMKLSRHPRHRPVALVAFLCGPSLRKDMGVFEPRPGMANRDVYFWLCLRKAPEMKPLWRLLCQEVLCISSAEAMYHMCL